MDITLVVSDVLQDASKVTVSDTTTYTTPTRAEYYSVFYAYKVDTTDQESALTVTSQGDPNTVAAWEVETPLDGHHRFKLLLYWVWEAGTSFVIGDIVERNGSFYVALADNNGIDPEINGGGEWGPYVPTVADEDNNMVELGELDCILFYRLKTCFAKEVAKAASIACDCVDTKKPASIQKYERLGVLIDGIAVDNYQTRYADGEEKVRYMAKLCPNCE